ncbi:MULTISPECIES: hypothetical protein [Pseudomonas]|uniref:hypothetical protein n=1 Tax=Pseudomonas TaxID=286 RepID=UPI0022DE7A1D|nr:hypothetical protein [Pseudomonas sp. NY11382]WBM35250.1 hypothetical protein M2J80_12605 [Pseudomonas sp. NY11382]
MYDRIQGLYQAIGGAERAIDISADAGCVLPPGYRLLRLDDRDGQQGTYEIALLNDLEISVVYYNKVTVKADTATRKAWRCPSAQHATVIADIADKVFFDYLVQRHSMVLSDDQETGEGSHYWLRQLSHALKRGLKIYEYGSGEPLRSIEDQVALSELVDRVWSTPKNSSSTLALICRTSCS